MIVVFDTNVIVEAIFWPRSNARRALTGLALRRFKTVVNPAILEEYVSITAELRQRLFSDTQPSGVLAWITAKSVHIEPAILQERLSRDPDDNLFVATARQFHEQEKQTPRLPRRRSRDRSLRMRDWSPWHVLLP